MSVVLFFPVSLRVCNQCHLVPASGDKHWAQREPKQEKAGRICVHAGQTNDANNCYDGGNYLRT